MISARLVRKYLWVTWRSYVLLPRTLVLIAWLLLRERGSHRRAIAMLKQALRRPPLGADPLRALSPGLYEVAPWFLQDGDTQREHDAHACEQGAAEADPSALTVVHLLGTGESIHSPLTGLRGLCAAEPRLRALRHVVVDTPYEAASYLGPYEFGQRMRRTLEPLLGQQRARIVFVGLSRGGTGALNFGTELAEAQGTRVGMLALSPPLSRPLRGPPTVVNIGGLEPVTENFVRLLALNPWLMPLGAWILRTLYVRFGGFVQAELRMASEASSAMYARHIGSTDPRDACLRAVREFALLGRTSDAELRHLLSGVTQRLAHDPQAHAIVCFGDQDPWLDVARCVTHLRTLLERDRVPAERVRIVTLKGLGHGVGREPDQDFAPVAALLWEACEHASQPAESRPATDATRMESTA